MAVGVGEALDLGVAVGEALDLAVAVADGDGVGLMLGGGAVGGVGQ